MIGSVVCSCGSRGISREKVATYGGRGDRGGDFGRRDNGVEQWRSWQQKRIVMSHIPAQPDMMGHPTTLPQRVAKAEAQALTGSGGAQSTLPCQWVLSGSVVVLRWSDRRGSGQSGMVAPGGEHSCDVWGQCGGGAELGARVGFGS